MYQIALHGGNLAPHFFMSDDIDKLNADGRQLTAVQKFKKINDGKACIPCADHEPQAHNKHGHRKHLDRGTRPDLWQ